MSVLVRRCSQLLAGLAGIVAVVLVFGVLSPDAAMWVSNLTYPLVAIGAGLILAAGARFRTGRSRVAWSLFGLGAILLGLGELTWAWYELVMGVEPPFPGLPDVYYLAAYPVLAAAVLVTPRRTGNRFQLGQQIIDAIVITASASILVWMTVLGPMYDTIDEVTAGELLVGAAYPVGDVILIAAIGIVGLRRSLGVRDWSLWCVMAALFVTAIGDVIYLMQTWSSSYVSGSWADSTWLVGYGLFALAAMWLPEPVEPRERRDGKLPLTYVLIPVCVILSITVLHLARKVSMGSFESILFETVLALLGLLVLGRILLTVGEDRSLVEEERKRLISVVSHELRTPLTAVDGYIDIALNNWDTLDDSDKREMIEIAKEQARVVTRIVTDLVETSRDSLHAADLKLEPIDFNELVENVIVQIGMGSQIEVDPGLQATVSADRGRLAQIVTNLIANSLRYGGEGRVSCVTRSIGDQVELAVHDSGPGVPARFRQSIWEPFERGVHRFDAATPGSGLGLAIVSSLARAHHGSVGYRSSDLLGGACFWVRIPRARTSLPAMVNGILDEGQPGAATLQRQKPSVLADTTASPRNGHG